MSKFKRSLIRTLVSIPRGIAPVISLGSRTFVFRNADVREMLGRDQEFTLAQVNGENISRFVGPFILGMDDGPRYQRDKAILRGIIRKEDPERIRKYVRETAAKLTADLEGEFDVIERFSRLLPLMLVGDYFGVPGPNPEDMLRWNRSLFWDVFLDLSSNAEIRANAVRSAKEMNAYLADLIKGHKKALNAGGRLKDNLLTRLITLQQTDKPSFDDKEIAGNLAGVFLGALEPINKAVANAMRAIICRPKVFEQAREAARNDDVGTMGKLAFEALRFYPNAPVLMRYASEDKTIGGNGRKQRKIKAGKTIFLMTQSAMFDKRAVKNPRQFDPERSHDQYLHFGLGLHTCYGSYINSIAIPEMLLALFKLEGLEPVKKVVNEGPFPDQWIMRVNK